MYFGWRWAKKLIFWLILGGFCLRPLIPYELQPQDFIKWKTLWRYILVANFVSIAYVVGKLGLGLPLSVFLGSYFPKYCSILLKFWPEVVSNKTNTAWTILQNFAFWLKWTTPNVYSFGPFWGPIYCQKIKNIAKTQIFYKN